MFAFLTILAEANPPAEALKLWIEVLVYIAVGIAAVSHAASVLSGRHAAKGVVPQPLEVKPFKPSVTEDELAKTHGRISRERGEIDRQIEGLIETQKVFDEKLSKSVEILRLEIKGDIGAVQNRITDVLAAVAELRGRINGHKFP